MMGKELALTARETTVEVCRMSSKLRPISPSNESTEGIVVVATLFPRASRRVTKLFSRIRRGPAPTRWLQAPT
jgi:hypothetical protein